MMQSDLLDALLWNEFVQAHASYVRARKRIVQNAVDLAGVVKQQFRTQDKLGSIVDILECFTIEQKKAVFDELIAMGSSVHGYTGKFHQYILSMPKEWLLEHIETSAEAYLKNGTFEEYRAFYTLYCQLDRDLVARLAHRASLSDDPDIKESGDDMFEWLKSSST